MKPQKTSTSDASCSSRPVASCAQLPLRKPQQTLMMPLKRLQHLLGHLEGQPCSVSACIDVCHGRLDCLPETDAGGCCKSAAPDLPEQHPHWSWGLIVWLACRLAAPSCISLWQTI